MSEKRDQQMSWIILLHYFMVKESPLSISILFAPVLYQKPVKYHKNRSRSALLSQTIPSPKLQKLFAYLLRRFPTIICCLRISINIFKMKAIVILTICLLLHTVISQTSGCISTQPGTLRCLACSVNLQLDDQGNCRLYTPIEGCRVYNSNTTGGCLSCDSKYILNSGICLLMIANCASTTNINTCDQCLPGFALIRFSNCYSTNVSNCPLGSLPRTLNSVTFCQQFLIINCNQPALNGLSCINCSRGFTLINGICFPVQSTTPCQANACSCQGYYFNNLCYRIQQNNCLQTSDGVYCDLCNNNFYSSNGFCVQYIKPDDINCNLISLDGTRCAACNQNYVFNSDFICVRNFQLCPTTCSSCPFNGFSLYQGNCLYSDPLCQIYNFTRQACQLCQEGYELDDRTLICMKRETCLAYDQNRRCTACFSGYQLNLQTSQCITLPPNCIQMNMTSGFCQTCSNLTTLSASGCIFTTSNCITYNINGRCQTCRQGFVQVQRSCLPFSQNCATYGSDQSTCSICLQGYHLINNQCYQDLDGCLSYSLQNQCNLCSTRYQLINGKCYYDDPNCLASDENGLCIGCTSGYIPARGRCLYYDAYCLSYDTNTLTCTRSFPSFTLSQGFSLQQQLSYLNFVIQAASTSQTAVSADFVGISGQGSFSRNGIISQLPYAGVSSSSVARYTINGNILACQVGFSLVQGQCVIASFNCFSYNQYGACQSCNPGYDLIIDGSCALRSSLSCQTQSGGICLVAAQGYIVINGSAYYAGNNAQRYNTQGLLISAKAGYFVWNVNSNNSIAWPLDANCISQLQPGACQTCLSGFNLVNGRCVVFKTNCVVYTPLGLCLACAQGYFLWAGECRKSNCLSIDPNSNLCSLCNQGFNLNLGTCIPTPVTFCQIYSGNSCLYCQTGYYVTSSKLCAKMINSCQSTNPQTGRCISCVSNYTYYNEQCIPTIAYCDVYSNTLTSCATCMQLYFPINNGTSCGYLGMFCSALADNVNCSACKTGFTLINQFNTFICVRPILNCFQYDNKANCIRCNSGYVLQYNSCKSIRCDLFIPPSSQCQACLPPFILVNNTCRDPNCQQNIGEICVSCLPRYYLSNGICILIADPNCISAASNGSCLQCIAGYALNADGICVSTNELYNGCANQEFPCGRCQLGYQLRNGLCYARKCQVYKQNRDCQTCIYYYKLESSNRFCILYTCFAPQCYLDDSPPDGFFTDSKGNLNISYCVLFSGPNCTSCQSYRYPNPAVQFGLCYPYNCLQNNLINCQGNCQANYSNVMTYPGSCLADNCLTFDNTGQCLTCAPTYYLSNGICIKFIIINCATIDYTNRVCLECTAGYDIVAGICRPSNCSIFTGDRNTSCLACINGYFLNSNGLCQVAKCVDFSGRDCLKCLPGYFLSNGLCLASNCQKFDPIAMICLQCNPNYESPPNIGICKPSNCNTFDPNLNCLECNKGYLLQDRICIQGDINCITWNDANNCIVCNSPSLIPIGNRCVPKVAGCANYSVNGCISCLIQYNFANGLCAVKYCQNYSTPDRCLICQNRFLLQSDGSCTPKNCLSFDQAAWACTSCEPRFQLISPFCFTYNCSKYDLKNYQCSVCEAGFNLIQDTCVFSNCLSSTQLICSKCVPGFNLVSGICQAPTSNCLVYDYQQFICTQCMASFRLNPYGICESTFIDPYCVVLNSTSGQCIQCLPSFSYNINSQQCESAFCLVFNPPAATRSRVCVSCLPSFALDSSKRYCISIYCLNYDLATGRCVACVSSSTISSNVCFANNCNNYSVLYPSSPVCQGCKKGFELNTNSLCIPSNCASFNLDLTCNSCGNGFALNSNGLCETTVCQPGFVFQNFACVPANCFNYDKTLGGCTQCLPGFVQQQQFCVSQGCIQYDQQYICQKCSLGYTLNIVNGQALCILSAASICPSGFYFSNNTCNIIPINNCSISDNTGQSCYRCLDGFLLRNNICYLIAGCIWPSYITGCLNCIQGYVLNGFICVSLNCATVFPNNTCQTCPYGYSLVNGACQRNIYKCGNIDTNGNCLQCVASFGLNNGRCVAVGCLAYNPITFVCISCASNYTWNPAQETCDLKSIPNCFSAFNASFCSQCNNGYVQLSGLCFLQVSWCVSYINQTGLCGQCSPGYYVNTLGQCAVLPPNCLQCDPTSQCITCINGFRVSKGICLPNIPNCQAFDPFTGACKQCIPQFYYTSQGQCLPLPAFCTSANPSGGCTSCISGYSLAGTLCVTTIINCMTYNQNNPAYCYQCISGYYLNAGYSCSILPPNCLNANSLGVCLACAITYTLSGSLCVISTPNCLNYVQSNNVTRCSQCSAGFTLTSNFTCNQLPQFCILGSNGVCNVCMQNFQLYQGLCVYFTQNCVAWNNVSLQCSVCVTGYYLAISNSTYVCSLLPRFCIRADIYGNCQECLQGYMTYNFQCVDSQSILNCRAYNLNTLQCVQCLTGYVLNSNSRCQPQNCAIVNSQGSCAQCLPNYLLVGNICLTQINNCNQYNSFTGICLQCRNGYNLSADSLVCSLSDPYCSSYGPQGGCLACNSGYYLRLGICTLLPVGCGSVGQNFLCASCLSQYTLINGVCVLIVNNCANYNTSGCAACISNYYLLRNTCNPFPDFCQSFDTGLSRCINCITGYNLNPTTYICSKVSDNCANYNNQGQCVYCARRFYLVGGKCYAYPNYCINVDFAGNCLSCAFGSVLQNEVCVAGQGRNMNCLNFDSVSNICMTCMTGYTFCPTVGVCLPLDPGCQSYFNNGTCSICMSNYQLFNGKCLLYPPGMTVLPNGGITCSSGYTFSNNSCVRNTNTLYMLSKLQIPVQFSFSSGIGSTSPFIGTSSFWSPSSSKINEYLSLSVVGGRPQIVFQVSIRGAQQGWVTGYVIQFKNRQDAPFICWNGCNSISGNNDGSSVSTLQLNHPIIATQLRIYPVSWVGSILLQLDVGILPVV